MGDKRQSSSMNPSVAARQLAARQRRDSAAEQVLVEQCRRKDFEAFTKVVDVYQSRVLGFVRRMVRNEEEALDVTQEVFIKAFQAIDRFDGRSSLRTWLFRIAHNLCIDRSRKQDRTPSTFSLEPGIESDNPIEFADERWAPDDIHSANQLHDVVDAAISELSPKLRTVLLMHDKEDMGYDEIAKAIDVPVGTVKSRLFLARSHIQKRARAYLSEGANV